MPPPELAVLVGLPGSGKSTFYEQRLARTHERVSKDLLPAGRGRQREVERLVAAALAAGRSVAVDNLNARASDRAPLVALAHAHGARAKAYLLDVPPVVCRDRNRLRTGRARVPDAVVFITAHRLEPPSRAEGFDELARVRPHGEGGFRVESVDEL